MEKRTLKPDDVIDLSTLVEKLASGQQFIASIMSGRPPFDECALVDRVLVLADPTPPDKKIPDDRMAEVMAALWTSELTHLFPTGDSFGDAVKVPAIAKRVSDIWSDRHDLRKWFYEAVTSITEGKLRKVAALRKAVSDGLAEIVPVPTLEWTGKTLVRKDYLMSRSTYGTMCFALMLLLDVKREYGKLVKKCRFCGRFFLSVSNGPGRRPEYCSPDHRKADKSNATAKRVEKYREKQAQQRGNLK